MDYLYRQDDPSLACLTYGRLRRSVDRVGCGLVAAYNVMNRLGQPQAFSDILRDAQRLHLPWLFGIFGTKPWALQRYFRRKGVAFESTKSAAHWRAALPGCRAAIICTWNDKRRHGIHFYAVIDSGGRLFSLNRFCGEREAAPFDPAGVRDDRFILGLLFY